MMVAMKIRPETQGCEECYTVFQEGTLIYHSGISGKNYCQNCRMKKNSAPGKAGSYYTLYVAEREPGELITGKLVLKDTLLFQLADGVYGLKRIGEYLAVSSVEKGDISPAKFMDGAGGSRYVLEKRGEQVLLLFSSVNLLNKYDFCNHREDYEFVLAYFALHIDSNIVLAWDRDGRIVGITNTGNDGAPFTSFTFGDIISGVQSLKELEKQCRGNNSARYVRKALEVLSPRTMLDYCEKRIRGQGIQLKLAVYQIYRYLQSVAGGGAFCAENWILTAPSGSGKTEFYRTIRDLFACYDIPVPVVQIDLSQITEAGYKGSNVCTIPQRILAEDPDAKGVAICFLDEADKKCIPSYGINEIDNNAAVQSNLLTLIEGMEQKVELGDEQKDFDSNRTMFILMGAFQGIRQMKQEKRRAKALGFATSYDTADSADNVDRVAECFYEDLTLQDMIDYGMQEELAGRMVQVVNFHKLSEEAMLELIRYKVKEISEDMGIDIEITEDTARTFLDIAFGSLGVRRPMNRIREIVQNTVAEVFFDGKFDSRRDRVVIDSLDAAHIERRGRTAEYDR